MSRRGEVGACDSPSRTDAEHEVEQARVWLISIVEQQRRLRLDATLAVRTRRSCSSLRSFAV
ncbi:hypothetical protein SAMN05661093_11158 [Kibdelosporangium aridum]|uniref:Uncharacterized protein n=1 Tax=Kibdelosporangium aridum TaxID=2030 RepID=A0A1W2G046_KIBAR|nr:hypothetical protein SAMN05661093_11158 [Kibdelosporangium aridum]